MHALQITRHTRPRFFQCIFIIIFFPSNFPSPLTTHRASILTTNKSPGILPPSSNQHARLAVWGREAAIRAIWLRLRIAQLVARAKTAGTKICPNQPARPRATTEIIRLPHPPLLSLSSLLGLAFQIVPPPYTLHYLSANILHCTVLRLRYRARSCGPSN